MGIIIQGFLETIYQNRNNAKTYETKEDIFNYLTEASKEDLIDDGNDIFGKKRVGLSYKGECYVENII